MGDGQRNPRFSPVGGGMAATLFPSRTRDLAMTSPRGSVSDPATARTGRLRTSTHDSLARTALVTGGYGYVGSASGRPVPWQVAARRAGDVAASYADPRRAQDELSWRATRDLRDMCVDAWRWQSMNPNGYAPSPMVGTRSAESVAVPSWPLTRDHPVATVAASLSGRGTCP